MDTTIPRHQAEENRVANDRILAVIDWNLDPHDVVMALRARTRDGAELSLLVPARLHGLDWIGDPTASRPCAERQLQAVRELGREAGLQVGAAEVGEPERVAAIREAVTEWRVAQVLVLGRSRRLMRFRPLGLEARVRRATGLLVESIPVAPDAGDRSGRRSSGGVSRCQPASATA